MRKVYKAFIIKTSSMTDLNSCDMTKYNAIKVYTKLDCSIILTQLKDL